MIRVKTQSSVWLTWVQKSRLNNINDQKGCCVINLENKIPPPVIAIIFAAGMWWIASFTTGIQIEVFWRYPVALFVALVGLFFCLAGVVSFRLAKTTINPLKTEKASSLVCSGIYRISRNPMYVGFALFLTAWAIYLSSVWSLIGVAGFVHYINRYQIRPEERALLSLFGAGFESYKSSTRRWI